MLQVPHVADLLNLRGHLLRFADDRFQLLQQRFLENFSGDGFFRWRPPQVAHQGGAVIDGGTVHVRVLRGKL
jgi:hypothetical protein